MIWLQVFYAGGKWGLVYDVGRGCTFLLADCAGSAVLREDRDDQDQSGIFELVKFTASLDPLASDMENSACV